MNERDDTLTDAPIEPLAQSGTSGGALQREIGARDDEAEQTGNRSGPTSVHKSDRPEGGDEPNLPNRDGGGGKDAHVQPRRS